MRGRQLLVVTSRIGSPLRQQACCRSTLLDAQGSSHRTLHHPSFFLAVRLNSSIPPRPSRPTADRPEFSSAPGKQTFREQLSKALSTPTKWYSIPIGLGALVLLLVQARKEQTSLVVERQGPDGAVVTTSRRVDGPWQVRVLGALPLRSLSRLWGYLNGLVLPVWFRPTGFKLYSWIFGCNLEECVPQDLTQYESLGEFFYRELRAGARPLADAPMVSPADGRVLHYGEIAGAQVEQVKGITYSLSALLGSESELYGSPTEIPRSPTTSQDQDGNKVQVVDDKHFAEINDIQYSLSSLLGSGKNDPQGGTQPQKERDTNAEEGKEIKDASHAPQTDLAHDASVALTLGSKAVSQATDESTELTLQHPENKLYFCVVYLAPGDYHRFHSPTAWVVERRRHFTGDLFSVSPYIANRLKDLFVLNERVALLGRWKYGFYSMVPVGATNVGSIVINFDRNLRTNTAKPSHPAHTYAEAVYTSASSVLRGQPLLAGEEMGGFKLGSTIVMVFEAPKNWRFTVAAGQKVKVGEALGTLEDKAERPRAIDARQI